jgi:hypothetical protein
MKGVERVHVYFDAETNSMPRRLVHEEIINQDEEEEAREGEREIGVNGGVGNGEGGGGGVVTLMTYDYENVVLYPAVKNEDDEDDSSSSLSKMDEFFNSAASSTIDSPPAKCERHVGGFPYIHIFHHYLKI